MKNSVNEKKDKRLHALLCDSLAKMFLSFFTFSRRQAIIVTEPTGCQVTEAIEQEIINVKSKFLPDLIAEMLRFFEDGGELEQFGLMAAAFLRLLI